MSGMCKIERGVKIPAPGKNCKKYPFDEMVVGDSFFVSAGDRLNVYNSAYQHAVSRGRKVHFVVRIENAGVRVWRDK